MIVDKIIVKWDDLEGPTGENPMWFTTKQEWDDYKKRLHSYSPREQPWMDPKKFPCIAIEIASVDALNGPYYNHYMFIYDFEYTKNKE